MKEVMYNTCITNPLEVEYMRFSLLTAIALAAAALHGAELDEIVHHLAAIFIEVLLQHARVTTDAGIVEVHHLELPPPFRGVVGNPQPFELLLEIVALVDVVVGAEHAQEHALAEAARADKKEEVVGLLHHGDVLGLVHEIFSFLPDLAEVGDAVGQKLDFFHSHRSLRSKVNAKMSFLQKNHSK